MDWLDELESAAAAAHSDSCAWYKYGDYLDTKEDNTYLVAADPWRILALIACARAVVQSQHYPDHRRGCNYCKGNHDCTEANRIKAVSWSMAQAALAMLAGKE